mgnify:CR=1 FL=1
MLFGFERLRPRISVYVLALLLAAVLQCVYFAFYPQRPAVPLEQIPIVLVVFSIFGLLAELKPIVTPVGGENTVTGSAFIAAILLVGPSFAIVPVVVSVVASHVMAHRALPRLIFNCSQYVLTVGISGGVYQLVLAWFGLPPAVTLSSPLYVVALITMLTLYVVVNTVLVGIVVAMDVNRPMVQHYRDSNAGMVGHYAVMVVVGVIAAFLWMDTPWTAVLAGFVVMIIYRAFALSTSLHVAQRDLLLRMNELQRRTAELELLNEVNAALTKAVDLGQLWEMLAQQVGRVLDTTCFFVALYDEQQAQVEVVFGQDEGTRAAGQAVPLGSGLSSWVITHAQPLLIHDFAEERSRFPSPITWGSGKMPVSVLAVPMILEGRVLGVISAQTYRASAYTGDDLRILTAIAAQAAVAINSAQLRKEAADAQALRHLSLLKTQFVSTVSHELRSPLTPIVGYSEILTMGSYPDEQVQEMGAEINRAARQMQSLVDDLLDLSRIETGQLRLSLEPTALENLVDEAIRDTATMSSNHEIRAVVDGPLPTLIADPVRIKQVLHNLLSNAVKYSPSGGLVLVRASVVRNEVRVSVADQGLGIPAEKLSRLFEMFYRAESELTRKVRGTGIGLAISKHIVESHGGRIWVESEVGRGSTFYFSLPLGSSQSRTDSPDGEGSWTPRTGVVSVAHRDEGEVMNAKRSES